MPGLLLPTVRRPRSQKMGTTMDLVGHYADTLRALGLLADAQSADDIEIMEEAELIILAWQDSAGALRQLSYDRNGLDELRREAPRRRGRGAANPPTGRAELLRTLGQELDEQAARLVRIRQHTAFTATVLAPGFGVATHWYSVDELYRKSRQRRLLCGSAPRVQRQWHWWLPGSHAS